MAQTSERRMNLTALQRVDANITDIIYNASQAALYKFNPKSSEWEKTEIEGTFFIYTRTLVPQHGFIVMNRLSTTNLIEPITAGIEFQLQSPFLLYKNATGQIFGIWFYDESECICIEEILNRLCQSCLNNQLNVPSSQRQRCASEGDKMHKGQSQSGNKPKGGLDIMTLLCQAQQEYDKLRKGSKQTNVKSEPKHIIENPTAGGSDANVKKEIVKPTPLRIINGSSTSGDDSYDQSLSNGASNLSSSSKGTALDVATLFAHVNASEKQHLQQQKAQVASSPGYRNSVGKHETYSASAKTAPIKIPASKPNELQRLFSNPANRVEHIEQQQLNELPVNTNRDRATSFSGVPGPSFPTNDCLEQDIKHKLNLNAPRNDSAFDKTVLNTLPTNDSNINVLIPHLLSRRHSVSPALTTITPAGLLASNKPLITTTELEGPIITPSMFQQPHDLSPIHSPFLSSHQPVGLDRAFGISPINSTAAMLGSLNFTKPLKGLPNQNQRQDLTVSMGLDMDGQSKDVLALTKDHLKEAIVYLLQNDDDFLTKVHEGYIASLKSQLGKFRFKSSNS